MASSIISTLGAGSGIDMASLTTQLVEAQFAAKIARLDTKNEELDAQISAASSIKNKIQLLSTALGERVRTGDLTPLPTISNSAVANVARLSSAAPTKGSYALEVLALAQSQSLASPAFANPAGPVGSGKITLSFGTASGGTFTVDGARTPVEIDIPAGASLQQVADAINGAASGVTAYVANTTSGAKLMMKGADGAANAFKVDVAEGAEAGLSALACDPVAAPAGRLLSTAGDALFKLDGLEMASATNNVTTAIAGLSINLTGTNIGAPTRIGFSNPAPNITSAMTDFIAALNEIQAEMADVMNAQNGEIRRDGGAQALRRELSALTSRIIMPGAGEGVPATLAELGVKTNRDGSFTLDTAQLSKALTAHPEEVAAMFTPGLYGIHAEIDRIARNANTAGNPGSLAASIQRYSKMKTNLVEDKLDINDAAEKLRTRLTKQFAVTDSRVSSFKSTMTFLENQIAAWNKTTDMLALHQNPADTYRRIEFDARVNGADQKELVSLLFEELIAAFQTAQFAHRQHDNQRKSAAMTRAIAVLTTLELGVNDSAETGISASLLTFYRAAKLSVLDSVVTFDSEAIDRLQGDFEDVRQSFFKR